MRKIEKIYTFRNTIWFENKMSKEGVITLVQKIEGMVNKEFYVLFSVDGKVYFMSVYPKRYTVELIKEAEENNNMLTLMVGEARVHFESKSSKKYKKKDGKIFERLHLVRCTPIRRGSLEAEFLEKIFDWKF